MGFLRHEEIYRSDEEARSGGWAAPGAHRFDEFPAGYSLAGCSPAEPASASPAGYSIGEKAGVGNLFPANGNLSPFTLSHDRGAAQYYPYGSLGAKPEPRPPPGSGAPAPCHDPWHPPWDSVSPSHHVPQVESRIFQEFIPFPFNHLPLHQGQTPSALLLPWNRRKKGSNVELGGVPDRSTGFRENESSGGPSSHAPTVAILVRGDTDCC